MPISSTANFSCDVNKNGGNDNSFAGPFGSIQRAIQYVTTNFTPTASQHAKIYIGPGVYAALNDTINISLNDATRYIDFIGSGKEDTIIQTASAGAVIISASGAENHFSDLTIETTSSTLANYALDVSAATNVVFENCKMKSASACIKNLAQNASMLNCEIVSTSVNAEMVIVQVDGLISKSSMKASTLATGGFLLGTLGSTGVVEYSTLNALSSGTPSLSFTTWTIYGKLSYCNLLSQGVAITFIQPGATLEFCYISTDLASNVVVTTVLGGFVQNCFFHQRNATTVSVVGNVVGGSPVILNSTFFAPFSTGTIVAVTASGATFEACTFINNGTSGYSLSAAVGITVTVGNITSNRPIDPGFTLTDNGLESISIGLAKGYKQKRWWAMNCNALLINSIGATAASGGTLSNGNDANGPATTDTTAAVNTSTAQIQHSTFNTVQRRYSPTLYVKFKINTISAVRFWCGLFGALPGNVDVLVTQGAGIRFSTPSLLTDFTYVTNNGAQSPISSGITVVAGTVYTLKMTLEEGTTPRVLFQINNNPVVQQTLTPPATGQDLGFVIQVITQGAATKSFTLYDVWCEYNA